MNTIDTNKLYDQMWPIAAMNKNYKQFCIEFAKKIASETLVLAKNEVLEELQSSTDINTTTITEIGEVILNIEKLIK